MPWDGPLQVFHLQPKGRSDPGHPPDRLRGSVRDVRLHGRRFPQKHAAEPQQDAAVGRTGEAVNFSRCCRSQRLMIVRPLRGFN